MCGVHEQASLPRGWNRNLHTGGTLPAAWELLKLDVLELIPISMAEIIESSLGSFTGPCNQGLPEHVIKVLVYSIRLPYLSSRIVAEPN
jgi:hypothetical protein